MMKRQNDVNKMFVSIMMNKHQEKKAAKLSTVSKKTMYLLN